MHVSHLHAADLYPLGELFEKQNGGNIFHNSLQLSVWQDNPAARVWNVSKQRHSGEQILWRHRTCNLFVRHARHLTRANHSSRAQKKPSTETLTSAVALAEIVLPFIVFSSIICFYSPMFICSIYIKTELVFFSFEMRIVPVPRQVPDLEMSELLWLSSVRN